MFCCFIPKLKGGVVVRMRTFQTVEKVMVSLIAESKINFLNIWSVIPKKKKKPLNENLLGFK